MRLRRPVLAACLFALVAAAAPPARAQAPDLAVEARNLSEPDVCAEKDNVRIDFTAPSVRSFRVQAIHPAYIGSLQTDRYLPDFSSCSFHTSAHFDDGAERVTFWETPQMWLVGYRLKKFWRKAETPVRVGDRVENGFDIVQLWVSHRERAEEVLVLYPPDGYWRIRPLPFGDLRWTAYGSSFLIGPVETQERPIVDLKSIAFDPAKKSFALEFRRGGGAEVRLQALDQEHIALDVSYTGAMPDGLPFASFRSMFTTEVNADVARAAWLTKGARSWRESGIMDFPTSQVTEFWAGRRTPSRHNLSAPDMSFGLFSASPAAR